jgi:hypothetical protein
MIFEWGSWFPILANAMVASLSAKTEALASKELSAPKLSAHGRVLNLPKVCFVVLNLFLAFDVISGIYFTDLIRYLVLRVWNIPFRIRELVARQASRTWYKVWLAADCTFSSDKVSSFGKVVIEVSYAVVYICFGC